MNAMKCILFFALAAAVYAQVGITEPDEDLIVPEATQEVAPMEFVDEEALQQTPADSVAQDAELDEAEEGKTTCKLGSVKGFSTYAWDPKGKFCYHAKFGEYVQQDWSKNKGRCNSKGFKSSVYIGRFNNDAHKYPNGDAKGCPGGKKRSVTVTVKQDKSAKETSAVVTEPSTCSYAMVITRATCPEDDKAHKDAKSTLAKAGPGACKAMADATEKEVKDNVKAQQAILDKIDKGANCPQRGQADVTAMKGKLTAAENASKDAAKKYNDALKVDVDFGKRSFDSLTEGNCNTFFNSAAYTNAKKKVSDAKKKKEEAAGKVTQAKKSLKTAEDTAKASVKICQCDTYKAHEKALADANAKVKAANTKAWTEAAHLKCVLAGKTTNSCTVPPLPKVKATSLATGVDAGKCSAWAGNPQCTNAAVQGGETRNYLQAMKTISGDAWNAGCYMKAEVPAIRKQDYMIAADWSKGSASQGYTMWGFEHLKKGTSPHQYQGIDFAAYCWVNIGLYIFEKGGQSKGNIGACPCKSNAKARTIMRVDGTVEYWMMVSNSWKKCYTSTRKAKNVPYVIDESIYQKGSKISVQLYVGKGNPNGNQWNQAT